MRGNSAASAKGRQFRRRRSLAAASSKWTELRIRRAELVKDNVTLPIQRLREAVSDLIKMSEDKDIGQELVECNRRLAELRDEVKAFLEQSAPDHVYWVERSGKAHKNLALNAAPIDVAEFLRRRLFESDTSIIMTSATLATNVAPGVPPGWAKGKVMSGWSSRDGCATFCRVTFQSVRPRYTGRSLWPLSAALAAGRVHIFRHVPAGGFGSRRETPPMGDGTEDMVAKNIPNRTLPGAARGIRSNVHGALSRWLDAGCGSCLLAQPDAAAIVEDSASAF